MSADVTLTEYANAAMVSCPKCGAAVGDPCRVRACRNGYVDCDYKVCSYLRDLPEPHLQRVVAARTARAT